MIRRDDRHRPACEISAGRTDAIVKVWRRSLCQPAQADSVIRLTVDDVLPAYQAHHVDLLGHLSPIDFFAPFLLARMFEATLAARAEAGESNKDHIVQSALRRLNHFVGYRPVAVLENDRRSEVYPHERFCPVPLYLSDVGAAVGPYEQIINATIAFMKQLPDDLVASSHFSLDRLTELSLDVRSHDHLHPVNKRTNYVFGEWDPDEIDTKGFYRRFIVRRLILTSLLDWVQQGKPDQPLDPERLFDASAVLAGTILMASAISGSGRRRMTPACRSHRCCPSSRDSVTTSISGFLRHRLASVQSV